MSSSDLPKLWTEATKIGHTNYFQNQNLIYKSWFSYSLIFPTKKKNNSERFGWFLMPKNALERTNFAIHNFCRSDDNMI